MYTKIVGIGILVPLFDPVVLISLISQLKDFKPTPSKTVGQLAHQHTAAQ